MAVASDIRNRLEALAKAKRRKCPACGRSIPITDARRFYKHSCGVVKCKGSGKKVLL